MLGMPLGFLNQCFMAIGKQVVDLPWYNRQRGRVSLLNHLIWQKMLRNLNHLKPYGKHPARLQTHRKPSCLKRFRLELPAAAPISQAPSCRCGTCKIAYSSDTTAGICPPTVKECSVPLCQPARSAIYCLSSWPHCNLERALPKLPQLHSFACRLSLLLGYI